jgi:hypothetical protein
MYIDNRGVIYALISPSIKQKQNDTVSVLCTTDLTTTPKIIDLRIFVDSIEDSPIITVDLPPEREEILPANGADDSDGVKAEVGDKVYNVTAQVYVNGERGDGTTGTITQSSDITIL